ncbi:MAG: gliding motility-associated C-terminal domain-containing protein [Bacteroidales bacterium]|jgi:gliding motility-associated-like protein|nr:gliding motility-associated C-terminal domain-containing protein [Bacteroidales bacterium]
MKRILLIIVLLFCSVLGFGQESNILCTQVNEDGTTTIFFTSSSEIVSVAYYNTNTNMFENIGDINVSTQTSFIDTLIANNSTERQIRYRVSTPSNTSYGNTMFLEVTNLTNSSFRLDWTSPHPSPSQQLEGTEGNQYIIFRKFASDVSWEQIGTTLDTNYTDEFLLRCSDTVSYRVELPNSLYSCSSVSNVKKLIIGDHEIPTEPILLTSSVDLDSQTLNLTWTPSTSLDTWGYIVCKGNPRIAIDTIWGSEQSTYTCLICSVEEVDTLSIMAFDTCYNTSLITNPHMNIVLNYYREACSAEIKFDWTQYFADPVNVITYELYVSQNNQDFVLHQTFTQDITSTTFIADPTIVSYCFYIKATLSNAYQVNSNKVCSSQALPKQVDFAYIRNTIVSKENDVVEMEFYVDASLEVRGYDLYRSSNNIDFTLIKTLPYTGNNTFIYTDKPPIALNKSNYFYKLHVPDECDLLFTPSNTISTIRLTIDVSNPDINVLNWNPFIGWNSIDSYDIYRIDGTSPSGFPIDNVQSTSNRYEDNIKSMISVSDKITYYIVAKESGASPDGHLTESHSSTASVVKESLIFVPNSFTPFENVNDVFKPFCSFIRLGTYSFKVYNRSGELIFETKDTEKGWDGKYKGRYCPVATYVYKVEFINSEGERVSKAGTVNLIN